MGNAYRNHSRGGLPRHFTGALFIDDILVDLESENGTKEKSCSFLKLFIMLT